MKGWELEPKWEILEGNIGKFLKLPKGEDAAGKVNGEEGVWKLS